MLDLYEINPDYPGIKKLIYDVEVEVGVRQKAVQKNDIAQSKSLYTEAQKLFSSAGRDEEKLRQALAKVDEAIKLNSGNDDAILLKDEISIRLGGNLSVVMSAEDTEKYNRAIQDLQQNNVVMASVPPCGLYGGRDAAGRLVLVVLDGDAGLGRVAVVALDDEVRDGPCRDLAGARVQDRVNPVSDVGVDVSRVLEGEPRIDEPAVHHLQVINVAESLIRLNGAVDEGEVLRVPGKVLTGDVGVVDGNVLAVPEAVLGEELRVVDLDVAAAVEGVVAVEVKPVNIDVRGVHPEIVALRRDVLEPYPAA